MTTTEPCKLFLLGGHDLEMLTIKQLLDGGDGCLVMDKNLSWDNAHLSAYEDSMALYRNGDIYGVELLEDIPVPKNYHRIDHHNDYTCSPSALMEFYKPDVNQLDKKDAFMMFLRVERSLSMNVTCSLMPSL